MEKYDRIGIAYTTTRHADPRILDRLIAYLDLPFGSAVADIGAGTGNYSFALAQHGYRVTAVEPSAVMQAQGRQHPSLAWLTGTAEAIPLPDGSVDGVMVTMAVHHFRDVGRAFAEMARVVRPGGRVGLFVGDPRLCGPDYWLGDYFRPIVERQLITYQPLDFLTWALGKSIGGPVAVHPFPLPPDLTDRFFNSGWRTPEVYLDPHFQSNTSPLATAPDEVLAPCLERLAQDLADGTWNRKYGQLLTQAEYDCGYRFLAGTRP